MDEEKLTFVWDTQLSRTPHTLDGVTETVEIVYKKATQNENYISLDRSNKEFHLLASDVIARISDNTLFEAFKTDLENLDNQTGNFNDEEFDQFITCWPPVPVWSSDGTSLRVDDVAAIVTRRPKFIKEINMTLAELAEELKTGANVRDAALIYGRAWKQIFLGAAEFSGNERTVVTSKFNVMGRFFTVPPHSAIRPLKLVIIPAKWTEDWLSLDDLRQACDASMSKLENTILIPTVRWNDFVIEGPRQFPNPLPECRFIVATDEEIRSRPLDRRLLRISTHPLNFFSTYIFEGQDLRSLIDLQVDDPNESWTRPLPSWNDVDAQNQKLLGKLRGAFRKKMSQVARKTTTRATLEQGSTVDVKARAQTQNIMGDSANKWARTITPVAWEATNAKVTIAEWLHREAHRFGGEDADLFPNLIFGSRECNTNMIRAETLINELLKSNKVHKVDLETIVENLKRVDMLDRDGLVTSMVPWYNWYETPGDYYMWMAAELKYDIKVTLVNTSICRYATTFQPFHRYFPLRYEIELDGFVLKLYLERLPVLVTGIFARTDISNTIRIAFTYDGTNYNFSAVFKSWIPEFGAKKFLIKIANTAELQRGSQQEFRLTFAKSEVHFITSGVRIYAADTAAIPGTNVNMKGIVEWH